MKPANVVSREEDGHIVVIRRIIVLIIEGFLPPTELLQRILRIFTDMWSCLYTLILQNYTFQ